jgi:hypothetical protein
LTSSPPNRASYTVRSTGVTVTSVTDKGLSLHRRYSSTAAALTGPPRSHNAARAASTPASVCRAATYRICRYSLAARSGCCRHKAS